MMAESASFGFYWAFRHFLASNMLDLNPRGSSLCLVDESIFLPSLNFLIFCSEKLISQKKFNQELGLSSEIRSEQKFVIL